MPNLHDIRTRRASVRNTQKITRAMKMVAASKLRRAQETILGARPYAHRMRDLVSSLARRAELDTHPLLRPAGGEGKVSLVVITSDRGLCGSFNSSIVQSTLSTISDKLKGRDVEVTVVGRKGIELLKRKKVNIRASHTDVFRDYGDDAAARIIGDVAQEFAKGETDQLYCLYNEFKSALTQKIVLEQLLPFEPEPQTEGFEADYLYEPSMVSVFDALLERHLEVQMHRILFESAASEHGARMTAMDSATNNAEDMIDRLSLIYNRVRQDAITKELIEVVSGAEAL